MNCNLQAWREGVVVPPASPSLCQRAFCMFLLAPRELLVLLDPCHSPSPASPAAKVSKPCKSLCWPQLALPWEQFPPPTSCSTAICLPTEMSISAASWAVCLHNLAAS